MYLYIYDGKGKHEINEVKSQKYHALHLFFINIHLGDSWEFDDWSEEELLNSGVWDVTLRPVTVVN